jgi:hypothetical protein
MDRDKWEYRVINFGNRPSTEEQAQDWLNDLGEQGWEVVAAPSWTGSVSTTVHVILKRRKQ